MTLFQIKTVKYDNKINDDAGSGARGYLSTWKPAREFPHFLLGVNKRQLTLAITVEPGWHYLGPAANNGSKDAVGLIIKDMSDDGSILRPVGDWVKVWDDTGSGKPKYYSLWKGVPRLEDQVDYVVIGGFFVVGDDGYYKPSSADAAGMMAICKDVLTTVSPGREVWNDAGSKATKDGAVWDISVAGHLEAASCGAFIPVDKYDTPPRDTYAINRAMVRARTSKFPFVPSAPSVPSVHPVPPALTHFSIVCDGTTVIVRPVAL